MDSYPGCSGTSLVDSLSDSRGRLHALHRLLGQSGAIRWLDNFDKFYVLPRDYVWITSQNLDTEVGVIAAAAPIYFNDGLYEAATDEELDSLITAANKTDIDLATSDIIERLENRDDREDAPVSYSWVHLNEFRLFELHNRCFAWSSPDDLREAVDNIL